MARINPVLRINPRNAAAATGGIAAVGVSGSNGSFSAQTITFGNSNGVSFYTTNSSIVASFSGGGAGGAVLAAGTQTGNTSGTVLFNDANGITFGMANSSVITASHNAITTGRASNDGLGLNTAGTNITWTANSSGLSINAGGYAGTGFTSTTTAGVDIKGTNNTAGLSIAVPAYLTTAQPVGAYLTTAAQSNQVVNSLNGSTGVMSLTVASSLSFSSNGSTISFGLASNITTALQSTGAYLTTARASNDAIGLNTAKTNVTWTVNSSGLSLDAGAYLTTQSGQAFSADASSTFQTLTFQDSNGVSFSNNAGALRITHGLQFTSNTSNITSNALHTSASRVINIVAATNSTGGGTASLSSNVSFSNANGVSFYTSAGGAVVGSVVTTYRASTDAIGLNTAQTNVTWTANSSGLSFNAAGYAGTTTAITGNALLTLNSLGLRLDGVGLAGTSTGFAGANISGSITHNSSGINLSLSVAAPGAAAENNWVNLLGANTAGNTTASGSTLGLSGINLTLSGTNNSAINISAPATSSIVGTNGISISTAGSTISVAREIQSKYWNVPGYHPPTGVVTQGLASTYVVFPFSIGDNVSFDYLRFMNTISIASTSFASTANTTFSYNLNVTYNILLYSQNTGASSLSLASISSKSVGLTQSANVAYGSASNTQQLNTYAVTYPISTGTSSFSSSYSTSNVSTIAVSTGNYTRFTGMKFLDIPFAGSLTPGVYWMALNASTTFTTQGTNLSGIRLQYSTAGITQINNTMGLFGQANNASIQLMNGMGSFTTAGGVSTASLGFSNISSYRSHIVPIFSLSRTIN